MPAPSLRRSTVIVLSDARLGVVVNGDGDGRGLMKVLGRSSSALAANYSTGTTLSYSPVPRRASSAQPTRG